MPDELLPLALVLFKALRSNLQEDITRQLFCFTYNDTFRVTNDAIRDLNYYRIDKRQATDITDEPNTSNQLIKAIEKHGFAQRLAISLQNTSPNSIDYPSAEEIYTKTGVAIRETTWPSIAREENIKHLLGGVVIEFT